ncbi:MAG: hypothetical protein HY076_09325 [Candidatus Eisenbacteria bacterium]|uniref:Uncharacterized protein n=1 Tax=Eiseniibacteriota bacterium TaxID=2212470 RepID=A0A9D6QQ19_UNCEI|nr:hypothetical protein [Candidatus Eisenbacteria bacterium]
MRSRFASRLAATMLLALTFSCSSGPSPQSSAPPPAPEQGLSRVVSGAEDSTAAIPGAPDALYRFRFRQVDPASDRFTFQDRELSFYFRPAPDALHFQIENRQDRPVYIQWDRSTFTDADGNTGKLAHSTTTWDDRFRAQADTQIPGLQRYSDYALPLEYLLDPAGGAAQIHRPLFPEDHNAPTYTDRTFGVELAFLVNGRPASYTFHFRVASVIPR